MKKIFSFIAILAGVAMFTSCGEDDATYTAVAPLEVSNVNVMFEAEGGVGTITVNSREAVSATTDSKWLVLAVNGNQVTATAPANISLDGRSAKILLKAGGAETTVTATQKGSIYGLINGRGFEIADSMNAFVNVPVQHTGEVTVNSLTEWLNATFNNETNEIKVVAQSNEEENPRVGYVAFTAGSVKDTLTIVQRGMVFDVQPVNVFMSNQGGKQNIAVAHSKSVIVESTADWFTAEFNSRTSQIQLTVSANTGNPRRGVINVKSGNSEKQVVVSQFDADQMFGTYIFGYYDEDGETGFYATLTENSLNIDALGWSIPVTVDKENMTVSIQSGSFVGTYNVYYMYLIFMDKDAQYWTAASTNYTSTATLGLVDIGEGEVTLAGDFEGVFGSSNVPVGCFLFSAFSEMTLDTSQGGPYLGDLLECYYPSLTKVPEEETAPVKIMRQPSMPRKLMPIKQRRR